MVSLNWYVFKKLDRLRSVCVIPKNDVFRLFDSKNMVKFILNYPAYIYVHCYFEESDDSDTSNFIINMPGCWIYSDDEIIDYLIKFCDNIINTYSLIDFSDIYIFNIDLKKKN